MALYFIVWILLATRLLSISRAKTGVLLTFIMCVCLWFFLNRYKPGMQWWYDTLLSFPIGMLFSIYKTKFDKIIQKRTFFYPLIFIFVIGFIGWHYYRGVDPYGLCSCIFALLLTILSTRIQFNNSALQWLGTYSFAMYIMQRWPMLIFVRMGISENVPLFFALSIPSAILVGWLFQGLLDKLDVYLLKNKSHVC